jgi:thioredoxin
MTQKQTFSSFDALLAQASGPLLVDFYATWCGPCQLMAKTLQEVKGRLGEKLSIVKIDTDKYPDLASRFGVQALPTLILFKNGQPGDRLEGALSAEALIQRLQAHL